MLRFPKSRRASHQAVSAHRKPKGLASTSAEQPPVHDSGSGLLKHSGNAGDNGGSSSSSRGGSRGGCMQPGLGPWQQQGRLHATWSRPTAAAEMQAGSLCTS
ncbi:MAG: hypothetical protein WDW38_006700 [Sanguina aurantia]